MYYLWFLFIFLFPTVCLSQGVSPQRIVVPDYPRVIRVARVKGSVTLNAEIAADGTVASVNGSTGEQKALIEEAEKNLRRWTFNRAGSSSSPLRQFVVTYVYRLEGQQQYYDSAPLVVLELPNKVEITAHSPKPEPSAGAD